MGVKKSKDIPMWFFTFAAVVVLYFLPLILLLADFGSGNLWFERNAPQQVKDAVTFIYTPLDWLMTWLALHWP